MPHTQETSILKEHREEKNRRNSFPFQLSCFRLRGSWSNSVNDMCNQETMFRFKLALLHLQLPYGFIIQLMTKIPNWPQKNFIQNDERKKVFIKNIEEKLLLKKFSGLGGAAWSLPKIFMMGSCVWRMARDGKKDVRMWVFPLSASEDKLEENGNFLVSNLCHIEGFCVTTERLERKKERWDNIHIIIFESSLSPRETKFSSFLPFFLTMILTLK